MSTSGSASNFIVYRLVALGRHLSILKGLWETEEGQVRGGKLGHRKRYKRERERERERERQRERERERERERIYYKRNAEKNEMYEIKQYELKRMREMCVCVRKREKERDREREGGERLCN